MEDIYCVTYQVHDHNEAFHVYTDFVMAESIGQALNRVDKNLSADMEHNGWSDYHITGINIVPELH